MAEERPKLTLPSKAPAREFPERVQVERLHAFIDENGRHRKWHGGDIVTDPAEIELLMTRGAVVKAI